MVWFMCDSCGDSIKKPKINGHLNQCAAQSFTCIDCSVTFDKWSVRSHTSCVSEKEKYVDVVTKPTGAKQKQSGGSADKPQPEVVGEEFLATRRPWKCSLCNIECTGRPELEGHAKGAKHGRKVRNAKAKEMAGQTATQPESDSAQVSKKDDTPIGSLELTEGDREKDETPKKKKRKSEENGEREEKPSKKKKDRSSGEDGTIDGKSPEEGNSKKKQKKTEEKERKAKSREKKETGQENGVDGEPNGEGGDSKKEKKRKKKRNQGNDVSKAEQGKKGKIGEEDFEGVVAVASGALKEAGGVDTVKKLKKILRQELGVEKVSALMSKLEGHSRFKRDGSKIVLVDS